MAKSLETRPQDLPNLPAWFACAPAQPPDEGQWDWLGGGSGHVEVTEFPVSDRFLEAVFGVTKHPALA